MLIFPLKKLVFTSSISILAVTAAQAQDGQIPFDLGTLEIYGDRTSTDAEDSTAPLSVVRGEQLDDATIASIEDTFGLIPNVQGGDSALTGFVIRGVNSEGQTPGLGAPLASFYIDGVQQTVEGTRRGARSTFDVEQVEVYRGPQSTLSGRAALAGAVYVKTKDPEFEPGGAMRLTYGSDNRRTVGIAGTGPVSETVAIRLSGEWYHKDSSIDYPSYQGFSGYDDISEDKYHTLRGKLLWTPTDRTRVLLSYSHSYDNTSPNIVASGTNRGDVNGALSPNFPVLQANSAALSLFFGIPPENQLGLLTVLEEVRNTTTNNFGLEITHEINANLKFTSMTSVSMSETDVRSLNFGNPGEFTSADAGQQQDLFTQEFRLNYESEGLRWVLGAYAGREVRDTYRRGTYFNTGILADPTQPLTIGINQMTDIETNNTAIFGEATYEFAPGWSVIAGGRLDHVDQETTQVVSGATTSFSYDDVVALGKLGLTRELANEDRISLVVQQGYRPGGAGSNLAGAYRFDPETSTVVELGYQGRFVQDQLGFSATAFWQTWDDQQVEIGLFPNNSIVNAGESESYGAEFELDYAATGKLDLFASVGLLHTEFKDFNTGGVNYTGLGFPNAPEFTAAVGYRWGAPTGWFSSGVVKHTGRQKSRFDNATPDTLSAFTTVDLNVGYAWDQARITAYATNLFDEDYLVYENSSASLQGLGNRQEIGLQLDYTF
ncbi:MAG: TonB-dependent receptor [Roseovarius confluentis]